MSSSERIPVFVRITSVLIIRWFGKLNSVNGRLLRGFEGWGWDLVNSNLNSFRSISIIILGCMGFFRFKDFEVVEF